MKKFDLGAAILEFKADDAAFTKTVAGAKKNVDGLKGGIRDTTQSLKDFAVQHKQSFQSLGVLAGLASTAVLGTAAAIVALGQRGAVVADVQSAFRALSERVGQTADVMLGALRRGVLGTVSDFELMKLANKTLGAGLVRSAGDMETLAAGARALAKRTGVETTEAFEALTSAIASGRTAQLKQLGLFIDSKEAVEQYAKAHKLATGDLNDAQRAAALSAAAIAALRKELREAAPDAADFGERIDQGKAKLANFRDELAVTVANSPAIAVMFDTIGTAIDTAFGTDQTQKIQRLADGVNRLAIGATTTAQVMVAGAGVIVQAWSGLQLIFSATMERVVSLAEISAKSFAAIVRAANSMPGVRGQFRDLAAELDSTSAFVSGVRQSFVDQRREAWEGVKGNSALGQTLAALGENLGKAKARMYEVSGAQVQVTAGAKALAGAQAGVTAETGNTIAAQKAAAKAAADLEKAIEAERRTLASLGLTTEHDVNQQLEALGAAMRRAEQDGIPLQTFLTHLLPKLEELRDRAKASGLELRDLNEIIRDATAALPPLPVIKAAPLDLSAIGVGFAAVDLLQARARMEAMRTRAAYERLGVGIQSDLDLAAKTAREDYRIIAQSGTATARELIAARQRVLEAERDAAGETVDLWTDMLNRISTKFSGWADTLSGAIASRMGGAGKVLGGLAGQFVKGLGAIATAGMSQIVSIGLGAAMSGLKWLGGKIGSFFGIGPSELDKVKQARAEWLKAEGGLDSLRKKVLAVSGDPAVRAAWNDLFNARRLKDYEAALARFNETVDKAQSALAARLAEEQDAREFLQATIEKYGFSIDEVGQKWREAALADQATLLVREWTALRASGIDVNTIAGKMRGNIQDFLTTALRTGTELPEQMRQMLDPLLAMGELVDENGNKLENLDRVKWSKTLTENIAGVIAKLDELIHTITDKLGKALDDLPPLEIPVEPLSRKERLRQQRMPSFAQEAFVPSPVAAIVGDAPGGEFVLRPSTLDRWMGRALAAGAARASSSTDGRSLAQEIASALEPTIRNLSVGDVELHLDGEQIGRLVGRHRATHEELIRGMRLNQHDLGSAVRFAAGISNLEIKLQRRRRW